MDPFVPSSVSFKSFLCSSFEQKRFIMTIHYYAQVLVEHNPYTTSMGESKTTLVLNEYGHFNVKCQKTHS